MREKAPCRLSDLAGWRLFLFHNEKMIGDDL